MTAPTSLPYGMRDVKLTKYTDASGSVLDTTSVDLPNMQTFSFSESEEFQELRGDDKTIAIRGQGALVDWELDSGGISLPAWEILTGGTVIAEGLTPNRRWILRKMSSDSRKYFRAEGQAISDSGGDMHAVVYRCRCNDTIEGEFTDGDFFITQAKGQGLPMLIDGFDLLYDFVQNETAVAIPTATVGNPPGPPATLTAGTIAATTAVLNWSAVGSADSYVIQKKLHSDPDTSWAAGTPATTTAPTVTATETGLTTATQYDFRVAAVDGGVQGGWSPTLTLTTA